ncbi:NAD(P)-dependent oxidoreductase [Flavobacteriales bacterium]|jgi:saccharopine dehydrogenase (NAD+, L-lysine-forming)|nr:NAD(P)-dependent oxidoreductase [Flavobacteriales bacterium]
MKIGVLKEEKVPVDKRVPLTPKQCRVLLNTYPSLEIAVKSSSIRCFSDDMYIAEGVQVVNDLSDCDVLIGVKEVPKSLLIPNRTYFYFSHTIKEQPYNRGLLLKMMALNISMVDYEVLKNQKGKRLLGFGRYAGIVGAYNGFLTYGLKSGKYNLKTAHNCEDRVEMEGEMNKIKLSNEKIIVTGNGRVGNGILDIIQKANIREVSKSEFLNNTFNEAVFIHLNTMDYNVRIDGSKSNKYEFYKQPELYCSSFMNYAKQADIFIAGHYYSSGSPYLFTREDIKHLDFKIKVVADVSCDINGPIACTIRPSTLSDPIYGYDKQTGQEVDFSNEDAIAVMAVDNLPCELPKDASEDFGNELLEKILPSLIISDDEQIIANATLCRNGDLTPNFEYLRNYVNGN